MNTSIRAAITASITVFTIFSQAMAGSKHDQHHAVFGWGGKADWSKYKLAPSSKPELGQYKLIPVDWSEYKTGRKPYDLVIKGGRVMDPASGLVAVRNVGIVANRIVTVTKDEIVGKEVISANGLVVAPGFIDTHTHGMDPFNNRMMVRDGVTSAGDLENGSLDINNFYKRREGNSLLNYFTSVSHEFARTAVMDGVYATDSTFLYPVRAEAAKDGHSSWAEDLPTEKQLAEIYALLRKGLDEGAIAIGSMPGYFPKGASTREVWEVQKIAAEYGRLVSNHPRHEPLGQLPVPFSLGYKEFMANAFALKSPLLLAHNNFENWQEINEIVKVARENGHVVWAEQYPYVAGAPSIGAGPLTVEALKAAGRTVEDSIFDPETSRFMTEAEFVEQRKNNPGKVVMWYARPKEWPAQLCASPNQTIANDGIPMLDEEGQELPNDFPYEKWIGHPRIPGARGKCLRLAREHDFPLMTVLNNASTMSANMLCRSGVKQMCVRGRVQEGMIADLVVLDPETVRDNSDYLPGKNGLPTTGIPYVLVSGQVVVRDSKVDLSVRAGKPIRYHKVSIQ